MVGQCSNRSDDTTPRHDLKIDGKRVRAVAGDDASHGRRRCGWLASKEPWKVRPPEADRGATWADCREGSPSPALLGVATMATVSSRDPAGAARPSLTPYKAAANLS